MTWKRTKTEEKNLIFIEHNYKQRSFGDSTYSFQGKCMCVNAKKNSDVKMLMDSEEKIAKEQIKDLFFP